MLQKVCGMYFSLSQVTEMPALRCFLLRHPNARGKWIQWKWNLQSYHRLDRSHLMHTCPLPCISLTSPSHISQECVRTKSPGNPFCFEDKLCYVLSTKVCPVSALWAFSSLGPGGLTHRGVPPAPIPPLERAEGTTAPYSPTTSLPPPCDGVQDGPPVSIMARGALGKHLQGHGL